VTKYKPEPKEPKQYFKPKKQKRVIQRPKKKSSVTIRLDNPIVEAPQLKVGNLKNKFLKSDREDDDGDLSTLKILPVRYSRMRGP
jgi:hypothetical protein